MSDLPFIDEHSRVVDAPVAAVWDALEFVVPGSFSGGASSRGAKALGCEQTERSGEIGRAGSTFPGFRVARATRDRELALEGRHRYSRYELVFEIDDLGGGRSRLRGRTCAEFPKLRGRIYKALVIGTRGHVLVTNRLLAAVAKRAERTTERPLAGEAA